MRNFKSELKVWFSGALLATALCVYANNAHAAPTEHQLCEWGEWAAAQSIELKELVKALNEVKGMPDEDKLVLIECYVQAKSAETDNAESK